MSDEYSRRVPCQADCTVDCGRCKGRPFDHLRDAITKHHERIKTLGLNNHRGVPQWGGPWDHELWATVDLPAGPVEGERLMADPRAITSSDLKTMVMQEDDDA